MYNYVELFIQQLICALEAINDDHRHMAAIFNMIVNNPHVRSLVDDYTAAKRNQLSLLPGSSPWLVLGRCLG